MSRPGFSVIIPTYNSAPLLAKALQSVLEQTWQDFEVIVVDNHSNDNTDEVIASFGDERIRYFKIHNSGVIAKSRNYGMEQASSEWLAFLDADDAWYPDKLSVMWQHANENPDAILLCHDMMLYEDDRPLNVYHCGPQSRDMYKTLLLQGNVLITTGVCIKREAWLQIGGFSEDSRYATVEDYEYWLRLALAGRLIIVSQVLGIYYLHADNTSKRRVEQQAAALVAVVGDALDRPESLKYPRWQHRLCLGCAYINAGRILQKSGHFALAQPYIFTGIKLWPFFWKGWAVAVLNLLKIAR